jgi:hypothetical protein
MLIRILVAAAVVLALMLVVKDGRVMRDAGLTGSCASAKTYPDGSQLEACSAGKLAGRPSLSAQGCTSTGLAGTYEYWRCPAGVESGPNGN